MGLNDFLKGSVRQWGMVKRFRIPPPVISAGWGNSENTVDFDTATPSELLASLEGCGLLPLYKKVCRQWLPYALRKLDSVPPDAIAPAAAGENGYRSAREWGELVCPAMALFYVGRRLGTFRLNVRVTAADGNEESVSDGTIRIVSSALQELSNLVGERTAAEIFKRLERVTDRALEQAAGKSTDR